MLTVDERETVFQLLLTVVANAPFPRQLVAGGLGLPLSANLGEGVPVDLVRQALTLCTDDGYRQSPPAIVALLTGLLPDHEEVVTIVERLTTTPPVVADDPFEALVLNSNLPFLDRSPTRRALRSFLKELRPIKRVVVINGNGSPGKTYTTAFVDHVLAQEPSIRHCLVTVTRDQGASVGPVELANDLVTNMGEELTGAPMATTNQQRWIAEIVNWVLSIANRSGTSWWFILDGFNAAAMRADTQVFIDTLATKLGTGIQRDRHRLILLDFDRTMLAVPPGSISDQTTSPVPHVSVVRAVDQILAAAPPDLDRGRVTASVLHGFSDPVTDLELLNLRLEALIQTQGAAA
jgi:hypothetical protein